MDVSQEYVKMCDEAEEIQKKWKGMTADFYIYKYQKGTRSHIRTNPYYGSHPNQGIWLPRQDQLQDMVTATSIEDLMLDLLSFTSRHLDNPFTDYARKFTSMEQLWLAYVMRRKFDKVWSGNRWVLTKAEAEIL